MLDSNPLPSPSLALVTDPDKQSSDVLVVGLLDNGSLSPTLTRINEATEGWFQRLVDTDQVRAKKGETCLLASPLPTGPTMIFVIGLGDDVSARSSAFDSAATSIRALADRQRQRVVF
jgi:hypothetical protein